MKTLIRGSYVVGFEGNGHRVIRDGVVVYEGDQIVHVGKSYDGTADVTIDAPGRKLVSPGIIDAQAAGGRGLDVQQFATDVGRKDFFGPSGWNFAPSKSYLEKTWPRDEKEAALLGAEFGMARVLKSGTTTAVTPSLGPDDQSEDPAVAAAGQLGTRAYVSLPYGSASYYVDDDGTCHYLWDEEKGFADLERAKAFASRYDGAYGGLVKTMLFPYRLDACSPELLRRTKAAARELNVHIRMNSAQFLLEFYEIIRRHAKTPVQFLADLGFLGPEVILHHCIFTSGHSWLAYPGDTDVAMVADSGASVSYSPLAFARRSVALESLHKYLTAGINMALGTDTTPPDMIMMMRWASVICKMVERNVNTGTAADVFNMATLGGAKALAREDLGRLAPGAKADIIIVDLDNLRVGPVDDPIRALVHYATMDDVKTVIVDGKVVVQDGRVLGLSRDEGELLDLVQKLSDARKDAIAARDWAGRTLEEKYPPTFPMD